MHEHTPPVHVPVLAAEVLEYLLPVPGMTIADGTLGGGGHTRLLAERVAPNGLIVAVDRDPAAIEAAERNLAGLPIQIAQSSYRELPEVLAAVGIHRVEGVLLDLGLSSDQLADTSRGFSYDADGPLDLRFDTSRGEPAWRWLDRVGTEHLADIIYRYGEERFSRRIARRIVQQRRHKRVRTARDLATLVRKCVPRSRNHRIDPATRTFQALRIAVNNELDELAGALKRLPDTLVPDGRLAVISFHSLEDRLVKEAFRDDVRLESITRKPVRPTEAETERNARSRSARLRVARRVRDVDASTSEPLLGLKRIVSGGQTGVDRGALDAAIAAGFEHGGWCPLGRLAEDGRVPPQYQLRETETREYPQRTRQNVIDSDGTLILYRDRLHGGTDLTARLARELDKPLLLIDLSATPDPAQVMQWITASAICTLNVAGPRESSAIGINQQARDFMLCVLRGETWNRVGQEKEPQMNADERR